MENQQSPPIVNSTLISFSLPSDILYIIQLSRNKHHHLLLNLQWGHIPIIFRIRKLHLYSRGKAHLYRQIGVEILVEVALKNSNSPISCLLLALLNHWNQSNTCKINQLFKKIINHFHLTYIYLIMRGWS